MLPSLHSFMMKVVSECATLVGCFGFNGPLRQYFSLYRAVSQREGERGEKGQRRVKMSKTTPTRTYCKRNMPLPYYHPNCRTPWHWKFTQHHRTIRPPPMRNVHQFSYSVLFSLDMPKFIQSPVAYLLTS